MPYIKYTTTKPFFDSKKARLVQNGLTTGFPTTSLEQSVGVNRYSYDTTSEVSKLKIGMRTHPLLSALYRALKQCNSQRIISSRRGDSFNSIRNTYIFTVNRRHFQPSRKCSVWILHYANGC